MSKDIDLTDLVLPERLEPEVQLGETELDRRSGTFVIDPMERGFGHTMGNAVRRVLLSSLRGAAVWAFRATGVMHEHQSIDGVREDVHQIIQSLKSLGVALSPDLEDARLVLRADRPGPITAGQISPKAGVTVLDPDHYICEYRGKESIEIDLYVNKGRGFVLADQHQKPDGMPVDLVCIDSIYNPVKKANFKVEETRVGQRTDFDRLTVDVETDGSMTPTDALAYAADLLRCHLEYMLYFKSGRMPKYSPAVATPVTEVMRERLMSELDDFPQIPVRARNSLRVAGITRMRDLVAMSEKRVLEVDKLGKKLLSEMNDALNQLGFTFDMHFEERVDGRLYLLSSSPDQGRNDSGRAPARSPAGRSR